MDAHSYKGFVADIYLRREGNDTLRSSYVVRGDVPARQRACLAVPLAKDAAISAARSQFEELVEARVQDPPVRDLSRR
jgi:hypothetical protein